MEIQSGVPTSITIDGVTMPLPRNVIILYAGATNAANGKTTFRKMKASAGYQVTTGKTLKVLALKKVIASGTSAGLRLFQSDNDVGIDQSTTVTGGVDLVPGGWNSVLPYTGVGSGERYLGYDTAVAAGKYLTGIFSLAASTEASVIAYCIEE